jgi:hypothetical protein
VVTAWLVKMVLSKWKALLLKLYLMQCFAWS